MIAMTNNCLCGFSVAVEYGFTPCYFEGQYFDVEIRCSDGTPAAAGKVEGGSTGFFTLPCEGAYTVTVSGPPQFSPRSQTKRVRCLRDNANGATFIFNTIAPQPPHPPKPEPCQCCSHKAPDCSPEPPCRPEPHCRPDHRPEPPCHPKPEPRHELNIRCSRNGITIIGDK